MKWLQDGGPAGATDISLLQIVQTDRELQPVSFPAATWQQTEWGLDLHLVPRLRIHGFIPRFRDVSLWYDNIWTTLPLMVVTVSHRPTDVISKYDSPLL